MALATRTIQNTIDWAKRMSFNRNPVIGNSLEPALSSAAHVMQAILAPPFEWWWNTEEVVFTANPTPNAATSTTIAISAGVITVTAANSFSVDDVVRATNVAAPVTALNGLVLTILTANATQFTANVNLPNLSGTTGTFTNITTQDYLVPIPNFSHIQHASVLDLDVNNAPTKWMQLTIKNGLPLETSQSRPMFVGPHSEDGNGNVKFRLQSAPDKAYPVALQCQQVAPPVTSVNQTWAPLPDYMAYIYDWGFLALIWQFADDPRAVYANNQFKAALLGRAEGLTEEQKNIFLNNWEALQEGYLMKMQQGIAARGQ